VVLILTNFVVATPGVLTRAVLNIVDSASPPLLYAPVWLSDGSFQFTLAGPAGRTNTIEASSNLLDWIATGGIDQPEPDGGLSGSDGHPFNPAFLPGAAVGVGSTDPTHLGCRNRPRMGLNGEEWTNRREVGFRPPCSTGSVLWSPRPRLSRFDTARCSVP
jgi:hypothetical protein